MASKDVNSGDCRQRFDEAAIDGFKDLVWREGREHWRELPWRNIDDPYAVLVSEVMLQQTQVKRVLKHWPRFVALFPTVDALASAETSLVLEMWQGLGYNRRALALKKTCEICSQANGGMLPATLEGLMELPGIGPATAAGVMAFAHDEPCVYLETNVRSVFLHHFFPDAQEVDDKQLIPLVRMCCPDDDVRGWYYALLDYGAHLKATTVNPSRRSKHHKTQSEFEGSHRQKRAQVVRMVLGKPGAKPSEIKIDIDLMERAAGRPEVAMDDVQDILKELSREGFFNFDGTGYRA